MHTYVVIRLDWDGRPAQSQSLTRSRPLMGTLGGYNGALSVVRRARSARRNEQRPSQGCQRLLATAQGAQSEEFDV
jgi:hypothetical protein